jgi:hypothetical protein
METWGDEPDELKKDEKAADETADEEKEEDPGNA